MNMRLLLLFFLIHFSASSQEIMNVKNKQFKATPFWNFISTNYTLGGEVQVQLAKTENGGLLKLSVVTTNPKSMIAGTVYVYLSDNSFISCIDKGQFENTENSLSSYFNFTAAEMNKLKKHNITSIRFNIKGTSGNFANQIGNFTAINKKSYYSSRFQNTPNIFETAKEINNLYQ